MEPENQESLSAAVESISAAELCGAELRADAAGHGGARFRILRRLLALPFQVLYIVVNQSELYPDGLAHWDSILGAVHKALFQLVLRSGSSLRLVFDEESSGQFLPGFQKYVESPGGQLFSPPTALNGKTAVTAICFSFPILSRVLYCLPITGGHPNITPLI